MHYQGYIWRVLISFIVVLAVVQAAYADRDQSSIYIAASSGANFSIAVVLSDSQGRKTGLTSVPEDMGLPEPYPGSVNEIPRSSLGFDDIDRHVTGAPSIGTLGMIVNRPQQESYIVEITGTLLTAYYARVNLYDSQGKSSLFEFRGVTDKDLKSIYELTYSPSPGTTSKAVRVATFARAKTDVELAFKINWIKNAGLKNSLYQKLDNADAAHSRGDSKAAGNMLNAFLNEVQAQTGKGIDPDAATMLTQDAQYLIDHL